MFDTSDGSIVILHKVENFDVLFKFFLSDCHLLD